jgi:hypothetical protein
MKNGAERPSVGNPWEESAIQPDYSGWPIWPAQNAGVISSTLRATLVFVVLFSTPLMMLSLTTI